MGRVGAGFIFGRAIRAVEWDVERSPGLPDGRVVSFKLRALTSKGLRAAIAKNYRLNSPEEASETCMVS
jgi:hypothetical protein